MSFASTSKSSSYLGVSDHRCHCGELCGMWVSRTPRNPGRVFIKCICRRVGVLTLYVGPYNILFQFFIDDLNQ